MENKDKIYDQFKEAATKAEDKGFARMDAVWNRVEEKLDAKKERRAAIWWKYTGIAALLLLFVSIGSYLLNNNDPALTPKALPENNVTVIDTQKVREVVSPKKEKVATEVVKTEEHQYATDASKKNKFIKHTSASSQPVASGNNVPTPIGTPFAFFPLDETDVTNDSETVAEESETAVNRYKSKTATAISEISREEIDAKTVINVPENVVRNVMPGITKDANGNTTYTGTVISKFDSQPVPGVKIAVKGSTTGVVTDFDGKYQITAKPGDELTFSFIGMKQEFVRAGSTNILDIALQEDNQTLEEVVVVGYGRRNKSAERKAKREERREERKKEKENTALAYQATPVSAPEKNIRANDSVYFMKNAKFTTSKNTNNSEYYFKTNKIKLVPGVKIVTGVNNMFIADVPKDFRDGDVQSKITDNGIDDLSKSVVIQERPNAALIQTLQGQVSGLNISTGAGAPGSNSKISIRGVSSIKTGNEPLYVIDGEIANANAFKKIDPNNIESINVLKDATSLYGNRAANGVIVVKTKKLTRKQRRELKKSLKPDAATIQSIHDTAVDFAAGKIKIDQEEYESFEENKFENPATTPLSTFSIDVDNASYTNVRRFINNGQTVPKDAVRVEEMINFFKYSYPQPAGNDPFSINIEYSDAPWNPKHKLLKIGLQGREIVTQNLPASNFVFLIDVSGSMSEVNKLPLLKQSMKLLVNQMRREDKIAIVVYAGAAGLILPSTSGDNKDKIIAALDNLNAGGSTAGGEGIDLAYKTAQENFIKGGNNRVILATDGDFNVGQSSDDDMQTLIEAKRTGGVFLTCLGYGMGNYKDSKLETLADKGNGNYAYIDNMQEADRFLNKEFKGSMYAIAKDVKIQIEFNPKHVQSYRLIGYENRKLRDEDFANDKIDAGELGSGHTVTALYEIIPTGVQSDYFTPAAGLKYSQPQATTGNYNDELATIKFRHKKPDEDKSTEVVKTIPNTFVPLNKASGDFRFAVAVAWFGLKLRDSKLVPQKSSDAIKELAKQGILYDPEGYRAEFIRLAEMVE